MLFKPGVRPLNIKTLNGEFDLGKCSRNLKNRQHRWGAPKGSQAAWLTQSLITLPLHGKEIRSAAKESLSYIVSPKGSFLEDRNAV